jgi:signal transduction histidine kinase
MLQHNENADKYSQAHSVITIGLGFRGSDLKIYVKDEGVGISSEAKEQVFSRFYQVDNTHSTRDVGGVGLGLAIVKVIVDGHKGSVSIVDNYPRGSVFEITIPQEARRA